MGMNSEELKAELRKHYNGTNNVWKHAIAKHYTYTDGVRAFCLNAGGGAYWLLDILVFQPEIRKELASPDGGFCSIKLTVNEHKQAFLKVTNGGKGDGKDDVYSQTIEFTDCPEGEWSFYFENGMIMLPSER